MHHAAAVGWHGKLYVLGGYVDGWNPTGEVHEYEPAGDRWRALAPMPTPRGALAAAVFDGKIYAPDEGVRYAMERAARARKPMVIADTQDNPGAGGDSDTTGMLRALVRNGATKAAIGVIVDPASAEAAHRAGAGNTVKLALGGKSGIPGDAGVLAGSVAVEDAGG